MSTVKIPHFDLPFRFGVNGAAVVEQDTIDDIANCVVAILSTHIGWRDEVPTFGTPDFAFQRQPIGPEEIAVMIASQDPRALIIVDERPDQTDELIDKINVGVTLIQPEGALSRE